MGMVIICRLSRKGEACGDVRGVLYVLYTPRVANSIAVAVLKMFSLLVFM